jgi:hypothetical protein
VNKSHIDPDDWSSDSEALFQAARADHDPTAADRARVRRELARRVAEASVEAPFGGDAASALAGKSSQSVVLANVAKLSIGVACVLAAVFAVLRLGGSEERSREEPLVAQTQQTTTATPAARAIETAPAEPTASNDTPAPAPARVREVSRSDSNLPARIASRAARVRSKHAKISATDSASRLAPSSAEASPSSHSGSVPAPSDTSVSTFAVGPPNVSEPPIQPPSDVSAARLAPRSAEEPVPAPDRALPALPDARAELALVERIQVAMLNAKPKTVLALCAEHERRWPNGTFAQEREGLRAIASCNTRVTAAESRARAFLANFPRAPLAPRVGEACAVQLKAASDQ